MKETNMEHFRGEIEKILDKGNVIAVSKDGRRVFECNARGVCKECLCGDTELLPCDVKLMQWLMSEYKPEPVLTAREKHFVKCIEDGWLTKSKSNIITWWEKKPSRDGKHGWIVTDTSGFVYLQEIHPCAFGNMFPFITWEDEEPWSVEELRKLKVK